MANLNSKNRENHRKSRILEKVKKKHHFERKRSIKIRGIIESI
ncbi:hypothetical protein ES708_01393 [subsurface metagenome]